MATEEPTMALVKRAKSRDREAFRQLVERYRPRLTNQIEARMGNNARARLEVGDVLQETFTKALQSIGRFRWQGEESFYCWLGSIAEHVIRHASEKKSWGQLELKVDPPAADTSPSRNMRRHERFDRLQKAINALSAEQRKALTLARFKGLKAREIAARMNRSPKSLYKLLAQAVLQLKKNFGDTQSMHLPDRLFDVEESRDEE